MSMSSLAKGFSTFNMCFKASAIPHFTEHLDSNPRDYQALMWRGQAHHIVGNTASARADFQAAERFSSGPQKYKAQYYMATIDGDTESRLNILQEAISMFPESHEILGLLGLLLYRMQKYIESLEILERAVTIIESGGNIEEPNYCWYKHEIGMIYRHFHRLDEAEEAFMDAINFSETHTVSHIGLARTQIAKGRDDRAKQHYDRARSLNPTIVQWENFEAFKKSTKHIPETADDIQGDLSANMEDMTLNSSGPSVRCQHTSDDEEEKQNGENDEEEESEEKQVKRVPKPKDPSPDGATSDTSSWWGMFSQLISRITSTTFASAPSKAPTSSKSKGSNSAAAAGGRGGGGKSGGGGNSSGSDNEASKGLKKGDPNEKWKQIKRESREVLKYRGKEYFLSEDGKEYYSRDKAGHGGSFLKVYANKRNRLDFKGSKDRNLKSMENKHESMKGTSIKKSDMDVVKR